MSHLGLSPRRVDVENEKRDQVYFLPEWAEIRKLFGKK